MKGIGASPGISIGKAYIKKDDIDIKKYNIDNVNEEIKRFHKGLCNSKSQIEELIEKTKKDIGKEEANIFKSHKLILEDPEFIGQVEEKIEMNYINSEWAIKEVIEFFMDLLGNLDNDYIKERKADFKDVSNRLVRNLLGKRGVDFNEIEEGAIIIAKDLTPSETINIPKDRVRGFITEIGGKTSHTAIMSRNINIPAIVGVGKILRDLENEDIIAMDGETGEFHINPEKRIIDMYEKRKIEYEKYRKKIKNLIGTKSVSKDGFQVSIGCNIGSIDDLDYVIGNDGEGIGLFRTEFIYMNRHSLPTEEEQYDKYRLVAEKMEGKPVIIRTLDIGGDKEIPYLNLPKEDNPFLGFRAIRYCLENRDIFKTQLKAILRASAHGNIKIMFPMISSVGEIRSAKKILEEAINELSKGNINYNKNIEVGIMIEIPSAALISDKLAKEVDFFSIGTNDLLQYTVAVDRLNERISPLYCQYHPALLRLIKMIIDNGHKNNIWVGMCGEVAGDTKLVPILLGLGLDEFSVSPSSVLKVRDSITSLDKKSMEEHALNVLDLSGGDEVLRYINKNIK